MFIKTSSLALVFLTFVSMAAAAEPPTNTNDQLKLAPLSPTGVVLADVLAWPEGNKLSLPTPQPNITRAYLAADRERKQIPFEFNATATSLVLSLPEKPATLPAGLVLETAEKSGQWPDGRIVLSALDATVLGKTAKLETHPGNHRIGYWSNSDDIVEWTYTATRPGSYTAELTYSVAGAGNEIEVTIGEQKLTGKLENTGSWYKYTAMPLGKVNVAGPGKIVVSVRGTKKAAPAVMNLKAVTLRPASEGAPITQADDGTITCHARDSIIRGVTLRWEPKPEKQTVGYWANASDAVAWEFTATKAGEYEVEILQGCGKNSGGSEVELSVAGQPLKFTVEDTGHFQNFVARKIGRVKLEKPGEYDVTVKPLVKKGGAVMDLRQVRLTRMDN